MDIHPYISEPPETSTEAESLVGVATHGLLSLRVWDEESERLKLEAEIRLLKTLHIGDRVAVTFRSKMDDRYRIVECEPWTEIGEIVTLEYHAGIGHISIHFDGEEKPTGPFAPREVKLIQDNNACLSHGDGGATPTPEKS